jgi:hypothetical protein
LRRRPCRTPRRSAQLRRRCSRAPSRDQITRKADIAPATSEIASATLSLDSERLPRERSARPALPGSVIPLPRFRSPARDTKRGRRAGARSQLRAPRADPACIGRRCLLTRPGEVNAASASPPDPAVRWAQPRAPLRRRSDSQIGAARAGVLVKSTLSLRLRLCGLRARWRSTTDREQRRGALGAVALPAGPTIREGDLLRVGDRDLFAADAPALGPGSITCPFDSSILRA